MFVLSQIQTLCVIPHFSRAKIISRANGLQYINQTLYISSGSLQDPFKHWCIIARASFWLECKKALNSLFKALLIISVAIPIVR